MRKRRATKSVLYTTIHPSSLPYAAEWYKSVIGQCDQDFDICIGVDKLSKEQVSNYIGKDIDPLWIFAAGSDSAATIREKALKLLSQQYDYIILTDSDDVLLPHRIEQAKVALQDADVSACGMKLVDEHTNELGMIFTYEGKAGFDGLIPNGNIFGFSNSSFRSEMIRKCLPIPHNCVLVDWFVITRAWIKEAIIHFDPDIHMAYRQHPNNIASVVPPFDAGRLLKSTGLVIDHYRLVMRYEPDIDTSRRLVLEEALNRTEAFYESILGSEELLSSYLEALNKLAPKFIWWSFVADPGFSQIWKK